MVLPEFEEQEKVCLRAVLLPAMREQSSGGVMMAGIKSSPAGPRSEFGNPSNLRRVSGAGELGKKLNVEDQKRRIREAEKAEKLMQLICWGPHSIRF